MDSQPFSFPGVQHVKKILFAAPGDAFKFYQSGRTLMLHAPCSQASLSSKATVSIFHSNGTCVKKLEIEPGATVMIIDISQSRLTAGTYVAHIDRAGISNQYRFTVISISGNEGGVR